MTARRGGSAGDRVSGSDARIAERRASVERRRRKVRLRRIGRALLVLLVAGGVVAVVMSPPLRVDRVRVEGAETVNPDEIATLADTRGRPLAFVDSGDVVERVKSSPLVLDARVRTDYLSRTVVIDVVERTPIAFSSAGSQFLLVDRDGVGLVMTDTAPRDMYYLTGSIGPFEVGSVSVESGWAAVAAEEISRWSKYSVRAAGHGERGIVLVTTDGVTAYLGTADELVEKGRALRAVQAKAEAEQWKVRYVDISNPESPAVSKW